MTEFSLEKLLSNKKNLERILDNLKEGIIAHDVNRRIFFLIRKQKGLPVTAAKKFWGAIVTKHSERRFAASIVISAMTNLCRKIKKSIRSTSPPAAANCAGWKCR